MASVYSGESWTGTYTYTRVRVDYSGTSATAHLLYSRTNAYTGETSSGDATFTFGGQSVGFNQSRYGAMTDSEIASVTFPISIDGGTYSGSSSGGYMGGNWSVSIPSQRTAPTGLKVENIERGVESFTATVSVTSWGSNVAGGQRYRELQVWTYSASGLVEPRRYQTSGASTTTPLSSSITVNNTSSGGTLVLKGNTKYIIGAYANNGYMNTGSVRIGEYSTLAHPNTATFKSATHNSLTLDYATQADGGAYNKTLEYSIDNGTTWQTVATLTGGAAKTGTFTISGLSANTEYTILTHVKTNAGTTEGQTVVAKTIGPDKPIVNSVDVNGNNHTIKFSVNSFNTGTSPRLELYGARNTAEPTTKLYEVSSPVGGTIYSYSNNNLLYNAKWGYRARAFATFSGAEVAGAWSDVKYGVTSPDKPKVQSIQFAYYQTAIKLAYDVNVLVPSDAGDLGKTISYRFYKKDTAPSDWIQDTVLTNGNAYSKTYEIIITNQTDGEQEYVFEIKSDNGTFSQTTSQNFIVKPAHEGPKNFDFSVNDNVAEIQTWLQTFSGYTNPIFIQGKSRAGVEIPRASQGEVADGATLVDYTFDATTDNKSLKVNWQASGTMSGNYALPTPSKRPTDLPSNQFPIVGTVRDSLDRTSSVTKNIISLSWSVPTISAEAERLSARGKALVRFSGQYARLQTNSLNSGNDVNDTTISYRVVEDENTVLQDWQTTTNYTTEIDTDKPYLRNYNGNITLSKLPNASSFIIQVKISDHFESATFDVPMEIWDINQVLYPPQYDIELWDWRTNTFVADLSNLVVGDLEITWQLNDVEDVSFTMDLLRYEEKCKDMNINPSTLLVPYKYDIRIRRNGIYILGCNLVEVNIQLPNNPPAKIEVKGTGFLNLFKDQYILGETMSKYTYAQIARRIVERAQQPDCIVRNPTIDIDISYWLAAQGTIAWVENINGSGHEGGGFIAGQRNGAGWITCGTQMSIEKDTPLKLDVWVKGQNGVTIFARERNYITTSESQYAITSVVADGNWQHLTGTWNAKFDNGYIVFEMNRTDTTTRLCVDDCFVFPTDDDSQYTNLFVPLGVDTASDIQDETREVDLELQNAKDMIIDLTQMEEDNFEFEFLPDRTFNVYARKGADKLDLEICYPGNIESMTIQHSASDLANKVVGIGSGFGDERLQYMATDTASRQIYGTHETIMNNSNISLLDTLKEKSKGELENRKVPILLPSVVIKDGSINPLMVETGDVLLVEVQKDSYLSSVTGTYKVVKIQCSVSEDAVETMTLTFEKPNEQITES